MERERKPHNFGHKYSSIRKKTNTNDSHNQFNHFSALFAIQKTRERKKKNCIISIKNALTQPIDGVSDVNERQNDFKKKRAKQTRRE